MTQRSLLSLGYAPYFHRVDYVFFRGIFFCINERDCTCMLRTSALLILLMVCGCSAADYPQPDPSCSDGRQNGTESDLDCGGSCGACSAGLTCAVSDDCQSGICAAAVCAASTCTDGRDNGDETDVDCGGNCTACANGLGCAVGSDCESGVCTDGTCQTPTCADGVANGSETAVDCGGACGPCRAGLACAAPADCESEICTDSLCVAATCTDTVHNADESDIDCGGACAACAVGLACAGNADCTTGVCTDQICRAESCMDAVQNGDETDVDCGGGCGECEDGLRCEQVSDCNSGVCADDRCAAPTCSDSVQNGAETDVDCGGDCGPCADGRACQGAADCSSGVCTDDLCQVPDCADATRNDDETDVDCGGSCGPCADGLGCAGSADCASQVCTDNVCAAPTCEDLVLNGDESDVDCGGGTCDGCSAGGLCEEVTDCALGIAGCVGGFCRNGPTAGFTIEQDAGFVPAMVTVSDQSTAGDASITSIEYDFAEGGGFGAATSHTYNSSGTFSVTQRVTDGNGLVDTFTIPVSVAPHFDCRFSATDISSSELVVLTGDRLGGDFLTLGTGGIRSECSVRPGSGVYYVELSRAPVPCDPVEAPPTCIPAIRGVASLGIGTATVSFHMDVGATNQGVGVSTDGGLSTDGTFLGTFDNTAEYYGFVVDYRGTFPIVHFIADNYGAPDLVQTVNLTAVRSPVHAMITALGRLTVPDFSANFGNDLTNAPFHFDPAAVLSSEGLTEVANALVLGFGGSTSLPANAKPTISVSADQTVASGTTVTVSGTASDAEDGILTTSIYWEDLSTRPFDRVSGVGGQFTFTATTVGVHPIRATVHDSLGRRSQAVVTVNVTGTVPQFSPVQLDPTLPATGAGIVLDAQQLRVRWTIADKMAIRANQAMIGSFQYFEGTQLGLPINQGIGLVVAEGTLNPYVVEDSPPSMSVNTLGPGVFHNLLYLSTPFATGNDFGFAVDYRGVNPIVYVIMDDTVVYEYEMWDVFVPIHPMLYGNAAGTAPGSYDVEVRFTPPFNLDPAAALTAHGLPASDVAALQLGWSG